MKNNQAPRVLIFSMAYLPFIGGAELAVKEVTDRISGFRFDLITARLDKKLPKTEKMGKINVYRVGWGWFLDKYLYPWLAYKKAKKLHKEKNYRIVQAIMAFYAGLAALWFKNKYPKVKYLLTMQSGDSDEFIAQRTWFWSWLYRQIYIKPDYIQAISQFLVNRARKYDYQDQIEIVPNGVDIGRFKVQPPDGNLKKELGITNEKVIITISRLVKKNGIDDLIKSVQYLDFPFRVLILGQGKDETKLKSLAKELNLGNKVLFLGHIDHNSLSKYLNIADVFVRPSLSEGFGNVFLEALACGVPVIGTAVDGSAIRVLFEGKAGLACKVSNPKDLAKQIKISLTNDMNKFVQNGQEMIKGAYTWSIISQKIERIYNKLLNDEK